MDNSNKPFDLAVEDTKLAVVELLNKAKLPITAMLWVAREVSDIVYAEYQLSLQKQKADYNNKKDSNLKNESEE